MFVFIADIVASVRKKLNNSERDRIDAVAKANEEVKTIISDKRPEMRRLYKTMQ